jgi:hypothetical protein
MTSRVSSGISTCTMSRASWSSENRRGGSVVVAAAAAAAASLKLSIVVVVVDKSGGELDMLHRGSGLSGNSENDLW